MDTRFYLILWKPKERHNVGHEINHGPSQLLICPETSHSMMTQRAQMLACSSTFPVIINHSPTWMRGHLCFMPMEDQPHTWRATSGFWMMPSSMTTMTGESLDSTWFHSLTVSLFFHPLQVPSVSIRFHMAQGHICQIGHSGHLGNPRTCAGAEGKVGRQLCFKGHPGPATPLKYGAQANPKSRTMPKD